jgi:hypothetical protein
MIHFMPTKRKPFTWVWRVENDDGQGPYRKGNSDKWNYEEYSHSASNGHPTASKDFTENEMRRVSYYLYQEEKSKALFGFTSIQQYKKWFNKSERKRIAEVGFKLHRKKASKAIRSEFQCLYLPYQPPKNKNARKGNRT